jgi:hypothetical protein
MTSVMSPRPDGIVKGVVTEGNVRCDECGGTMPVGSDIVVLVNLDVDVATTNCGSCYKDGD